MVLANMRASRRSMGFELLERAISIYFEMKEEFSTSANCRKRLDALYICKSVD